MAAKIICDHCEADLTTTGNCDDYRIKLEVERIPSAGGAVTLMAVYPPFGGGIRHFCGKRCFRHWTENEFA